MLFKSLGMQEADVQRLQLELMREKEQQDLLAEYIRKEERVKFVPQWHSVNLPAGSVPLLSSNDPFAVEGQKYLQERGVLDLAK